MSATAQRREPWLVAGALALAAAAWAVTSERMDGMDAGPGGELGGLGWFAVSWLAMMAAMMLPALAPMLAAYGRRAGATPAFAAGYLLAWLAAGLAAYAAIEAVRSFEPGFLAWRDAGRYVSAAVVVAAGLYQLTPAKRTCLRRCRARAAFLRRHSRQGALRMGAAHGADCLGCSWALMAALFALGVMSLAWMALVTLLITAERLLGGNARLAVALVLVALGAAVALVPADVPALTLPSGGSMSGMQMR